ncbi:MAG: DUF3048 domain-containing protein, partial [Chloroflexi bacterium]|nr:DUF3048 domain-containing protein [Chloroflexota bacterium]
ESDRVRPQSGLAFADHVWEYQMEGYAQTRFTAVFLTHSPERVGSVRSIRLIDINELAEMYGGMLVTSGSSSNRLAGGPPRINELLRAKDFRPWTINADFGFDEPYLVRIPDVPRVGTPFYHSLFAVPEEIWAWAEEEGHNVRQNLDGMAFDFTPPPDGIETTRVWIDYPGRGPEHFWDWDADSGRWLSFTRHELSPDELTPDGDTLLPDEQLAFDNVVILFAEHYNADFIEDEAASLFSVETVLKGTGNAVLMRDGQRYNITWQRDEARQMLSFFDVNGQPIAFKPGTTWFNVASTTFGPPTIEFTPSPDGEADNDG